MALQQEIWIHDIKEVLFQPNPFMSRATDHSQFVNFKTVHVPQAGAAQTVVKNRTALPATMSQRTDTELTYSLNEYTSNPIAITNLEELQINYNKRQSILNATTSKISEVIANQTLYSWAASGSSRILRTTGTADALALTSGATGTRNAITLLDIQKLRAVLDNDNVPMDGRVLLMTASMYNNQFLSIANVQQYLSYGQAILPTGVVNKIMGFDIMIRPDVLVYDNTGTPVIKTIGDEGTVTTTATTDNAGCLAYHPQFVAHALGGIEVFSRENDPLVFGSIFSSLVMHGSSKLRTDQKGVVALVQA